MKLNSLFLVGFTALFSVLPVFSQSERPGVAFLDIPVAKGAYAGWAGWDHSNEAKASDVLRDLFTTEFIDKGVGKLRIVERARIEEIRNEQAFGQSGEVDSDTAVNIGKLLGVKYMITGKITRFATKAGGFSTGGLVSIAASAVGAGPIASYVAGSIKIKTATFSGRLDMRIIDVESGEIIAAVADEGSKKIKGIKVAGTGNDVQYDETMISQVFEPIVKSLTTKLIDRILTASE